MEEMVFFDEARNNITSFFEKEFENFPPLLMSHFLNKFNDILNYTEEEIKIIPKIIFTNNIEAVSKISSKTNLITVFEDSEATMFNNRLKSLLAICKNDWCVFIEIKENKISYGLVVCFRSIKDRNFLQVLEDNQSLKEKVPKVQCIVARPLNLYSMYLYSVTGEKLIVNLSLDKSKNNFFKTEINELVDASFFKLRTTQRKLQDMKNMYKNIFNNVMNDIHGAICVIVDKEYKDNGLFSDGVWLKEPISFSKLFNKSKCYSEEKLQAYAELFIKMLSFDGITIIDNLGRLRAYNVFVEPNSKRVGYIVGGARKRAAFYILSTKKKDIVGVYFQSHEGEVFFQEMSTHKQHMKPKSTPKEVGVDEIKKPVEEKQN